MPRILSVCNIRRASVCRAEVSIMWHGAGQFGVPSFNCTHLSR